MKSYIVVVVFGQTKKFCRKKGPPLQIRDYVFPTIPRELQISTRIAIESHRTH